MSSCLRFIVHYSFQKFFTKALVTHAEADMSVNLGLPTVSGTPKTGRLKRDNVEFGRFMICKSSLARGIGSFVYHSGASISHFQTRTLTHGLHKVLTSLLENPSQPINAALDRLDREDVIWMRKLVDRSHVYIKDLVWPACVNVCTMRDGLPDAKY